MRAWLAIAARKAIGLAILSHKLFCIYEKVFLTLPITLGHCVDMKSERSTDNRDIKSRSQSLDRGLQVLEMLAASDTELGVRDLARELGIAKSIVQRLLNTLVDRAFIEQEPQSRKYRIGSKSFEIGAGFTRSGSLAEICLPELEKMAKAHQLNCYLGILRDSEALYLATIQGSGPIAIQVSPGDRIALHTTALGKALLLDMSDAEIRNLLTASRLTRRTASTKVSVPALIAEIRKAEKHGYTLSLGENIIGIYSFGAPIRDKTGRIVAAISGALPQAMMQRKALPQLGEAVAAIAERISQRLGASSRNLAASSRTPAAAKFVPAAGRA